MLPLVCLNLEDLHFHFLFSLNCKYWDLPYLQFQLFMFFSKADDLVFDPWKPLGQPSKQMCCEKST